MPDIYFTSKAWEDIGWWVENDLKTLRKIYKLIDAASKSTFSGLGHPEPLKSNYSGYWARRINHEHRMVYKIEKNKLIIHSLYGHYLE